MTAWGNPLGSPQAPALWLFATVAATLAPHAAHLPAWLMGLALLLLALRAGLAWRARPAPPPWLLALAAAAAGLGVKVEFGIFFGKDPGIAFLAILLCLKQLETRGPRDFHAAILLAFFLQLGLFFYQQNVAVAALALAGALFAASTLVALQDRHGTTGEVMRTGGLLIAQGLPFMVALFILFPRVQGPLWGLPADAYSGMSGLSDTMSPGSIAELGLSDAIAFRAEFDGPPPPPGQRYWRGPVLGAFDGRTWRQSPANPLSEPRYQPSGRRYDYRITLEPHNRTWLLALDYPAGTVPGARFTSDFRLLATEPVRNRTRIALAAYPNTPVGLDESAAILAQNTRLPAGTNPRSRNVARELAQGAANPAQILEHVLAFLRERKLVYTLQPPLLGTHTVDELLFDTRRGFCEHFASAFVFLMRAGGVPARVVTGYQGGEINPYDQTLVVRQSDAHAWAEVWLPERGWVRVDPTALAAPERIERGLVAALPFGETRPLLMQPDLLWLRTVRHRWEAISNSWNQWVIGYNPERQRELLDRLGFPHADWRTYGALLGSSGALLILMLLVWNLWRPSREDRLDRVWRQLGRKCARHGCPRPPWEGPRDYGTRLAHAFPQHAPTLVRFAETYATLRYGARQDHEAEHRLARQIRRFRFK